MTYNREFLTLKDEFIKKTLMECETIANVILYLFSRLKNCTEYYNCLID